MNISSITDFFEFYNLFLAKTTATTKIRFNCKIDPLILARPSVVLFYHSARPSAHGRSLLLGNTGPWNMSVFSMVFTLCLLLFYSSNSKPENQIMVTFLRIFQNIPLNLEYNPSSLLWPPKPCIAGSCWPLQQHLVPLSPLSSALVTHWSPFSACGMQRASSCPRIVALAGSAAGFFL